MYNTPMQIHICTYVCVCMHKCFVRYSFVRYATPLRRVFPLAHARTLQRLANIFGSAACNHRETATPEIPPADFSIKFQAS